MRLTELQFFAFINKHDDQENHVYYVGIFIVSIQLFKNQYFAPGIFMSKF